MAALGLIAGMVAALVLSRFMGSLLFGIEATDPATFLAVPGLLALAALAASYIPARRAAGIDPAVSLRSD
jgi:ABC-type antimicrobial peptide transport system permease subunit